MEEIELQKITTKGFGFTGKVECQVLKGMKFDNGKIAFLDSDKEIKTLNSADDLEEHPTLKIVKKA